MAHEALPLAGRLARALSAGGRPVMAHLDARAGGAEGFVEAAGAGVRLLPRRRAEWGTFGLVAPVLEGVRALLASGAAFSHVQLVSGACLPLRPLAELDAFLAAGPETDHLEARPVGGAERAAEGLERERFTLFHPFPWRRRKRLFDLSVEVQRRLGVKRRPPAALDLAIGSQWWTLSRGTLERIMADPELPALERFFRSAWIPDESFFQSLALRHSRRVSPLSLTLARFDEAGVPYVFHDDHAGLLDGADHFFVRKVHAEAEGLRARLLARAGEAAAGAGFEGRAPEAAFRAARESRTRGREALISPARLKARAWWETPGSPAPYLAIGGVEAEQAARLSVRLTGAGLICHGRLFGPDAPAFAGGARVAAGGVPASRAARDLWPEQFLINLARGAAASGAVMAFCLPLEDRAAIGVMVAADPGAHVLWFRGGRRGEAAAAERAFLAEIRRGGAALEIAPRALLADDEDAAAALILRAAEGLRA